jgi:putative PIN family toxin of toxin-antitoxin system
MRIRAVVDTNVLVSGLMSESGPPSEIVDAWLEGRYTLITSPYMVEELVHVLSYPRIRDRLRLERDELQAIVIALLAQAEVTPGQLPLADVTRDPRDDAVVACAIEGGAEVIVSGDQDLLALGTYRGIEVVTPRRFTELLAAGG